MNFAHLTRIGLTLLVCLYMSSNFAYGQTLTQQDFTTPTAVQEELFGFNGGFMMEVCGATTDSIYAEMPFPLKDYHLLESCLDFTNKLNPNILRFPGGTGANYYHFNGTGYGFQPLEVIGSKFEGMVADDARLPVNHIENFADMALQSGTKAIYVINVLTHFKSGGKALVDPTSSNYMEKLQENLAGIDYLISKGVEVVGVELGNEVYAYIEINGSNGTRNQYINLAKVYTDSIKQRYPEMEVGVPLMPVAGLIDIYFNDWNKAMKYTSFADAYIIHTYEKKVMNFCSEDLSKEEYFECAKEKIDSYLDVGFENTLNYFWTFYGRSKQIWLTEWNILDPQRVGNTFLHAYFIQKHWNKLMELEKKYPGDIGFTNCHNFISGGWLYPSVGYQQPNESASTVITDQFSLRAAYYSNLMMSPILKAGNEFIGQTTIEDCEAWLYKTKSGAYDLVILNTTSEAKTINVATINEIILDSEENLGFTSYSSLSADNMYDACGINHFNLDQSDVTNELSFVENEKIENNSPLNLNGLSLSVVRIESKATTPPFNIDNFTASINDCEIILNWSSINDRASISYLVYENEIVIDTLVSLGTATTNDYTFQFIPDSNQQYTFQLEAIENEISIVSDLEASANIDCIPIPNPVIVATQLNVNNECEITYTWQVDNQVATTNYIVTTTFESESTIDTVFNNFDNTYSFVYPSLGNGDYSFELTILDENEVVSVNTADEYTLDCIESPEPTITFTQLTVDNNCNIVYTWQVENHVESTNFIVVTSIGNVTTLDTITSSLATLYSYTYIPEENGDYTFQIALLDEETFLNATSPELLTIDCIVLPPIVTNFSVTQNNDCSYTANWTVINEQLGSSYQLSSDINGSGFKPVNMQFALGNFAAYNYTYTFYPNANGSYDFQLIQFMNGGEIATLNDTPIDVTCAPLPDPVLENFQVTAQNDCSFNIEWSVSEELSSSSYKIYAKRNEGSLMQIHTLNATDDNAMANYQFIYNPELNGSYVFELEQFNEDELVTTANYAIPINCVENPDPLITNFMVSDNGDCTFDVRWTTAFELSTSSYTVFVNLDNDSLESIQTINSITSADSVDYQFTFVPDVNGTYEIVIQQFNEGILIASPVSDSISITCILPPDPIASNFTVNETNDCNYQLNWEVTDELLTSTYEVAVSVNGSTFMPITTFHSTEAVNTTTYSVNYLPETNGDYIFKIEQFNNAILVNTLLQSNVVINCVPTPDPFIESFTITNNGNCTFEVEWTVSNESATTSYELIYAIEGQTMETIFTTPSHGTLSNTNYSYTFTPAENHPYDFQVVQLDNNEFLSTSTIATAFVVCIEVPEPILHAFNVTSNDDCTVDLSWKIENQNENTLIVINESYEDGSFLPKDAINGNLSNSNETINYSLPVNEAGEYTYHLEIFQNETYVNTSFDESTYVNCPQNISLSITAYPVITFGAFTTKITTNQALEGELKIVNIFTGSTVLKEDITIADGINKLDYNFDNMSNANSGLYVISFSYSGGTKYTTIIYL